MFTSRCQWLWSGCDIIFCLYCAGVCLVCYSLIGYSAYRCQSRMVQLTTVIALNPNLNKVIISWHQFTLVPLYWLSITLYRVIFSGFMTSLTLNPRNLSFMAIRKFSTESIPFYHCHIMTQLCHSEKDFVINCFTRAHNQFRLIFRLTTPPYQSLLSAAIWGWRQTKTTCQCPLQGTFPTTTGYSSTNCRESSVSSTRIWPWWEQKYFNMYLLLVK